MRPLINEVRFNRLLTRSALLPLLLMAALSGLLIWQINHLLRVFEWEGHSDQIIAQANLSQKLLLDRETGKRGYLLTGDPRFLQPYSAAGTEVGPALNALGGLVAGSRQQHRRVETIRALTSQWDDDAETTIAHAGVLSRTTPHHSPDDQWQAPDGRHARPVQRPDLGGGRSAGGARGHHAADRAGRHRHRPGGGPRRGPAAGAVGAASVAAPRRRVRRGDGDHPAPGAGHQGERGAPCA